ncbi:serine/threonine-protein kinase [Dokdonella sp.]|uniref:serine/threonine-protein kinase n=1 Tax=Dokdonella sp. TaxID=2291710 RepID=UPI001B17F150|nr:serine/threonine-protein kinase [Dokdonella sp.]MBO9663976.1 protein kinase [Dokdonella sp.]
MSDPVRWQRLQELFDGLVARAPQERAGWLAGLDADDDLKREALSLIETEEGNAGGVTAQLHAVAHRMSTPWRDHRLGAYRLVEEIGSGGMGTVFLAERVDEAFDQRVAIKLLRGIPTRESTERMRRERQILADLAHPHIARLLDGGSTSDGQPYLVMEYVDGVPLNEFCVRHEPSPAARLQLVQKLCAAVQYAHQRLVIHRDLKPANVLVRADGEPILLDFGIAKLLADGDPDAAQTALPWFTPAYASPEQRRQERVSTATDVHGLGVLLYEVLTGVTPALDADGRLPPPSRVAAHRVERELDLIVAKATHPEPERRYVSAAALAEDLQRHAQGRPVHAAPDRLPYRVGKFVRRHRLASAAVLAAIVLATLFTWRLARERDRALRAEAVAQEQSTTAESVVDYLVALFRSASPDVTGTDTIAPRDLVDRGRKEIDARLADAPQQRARLLGTFGQIYNELGLPDEAAQSFADAAAIEREHGTIAQRAHYLAEQGYALNLAERTQAAVPILREAESLLGEIDADERAAASELLTSLGIALARNGEIEAGDEAVQRGLAYAAQSAGEDSVLYAQALNGLAETQLRANRLSEAEAAAVKGLELMRRHKPEDSAEVLATSGFLTQVYDQQDRYAESERLLRRMLEVRLRTLEPDSAWAITARNNLARAIYEQGRMIEASDLFRQNIEHLRARKQEQTPSYLIGLNNLASLLEQTGDYTGSLALFEEMERRAAADATAGNASLPASMRQNHARSLVLNDRLDEAYALLSSPVEGADAAMQNARRLLHLAEWMRRKHRYEEALRYLDQASAAFAALFPDQHSSRGALARTRGLIYRDQNRLDEAERELRFAAENFARTGSKDANPTIEVELQLADVQFARGHADEARALHARVTPLLDERFVAQSGVRAQHAALGKRLAGVKPVAIR